MRWPLVLSALLATTGLAAWLAIPRSVFAGVSLLVLGCASLLHAALGFWLFWADKRASFTEGAERIPERVLLGCAALGAWPGSWVASRLFRHKTRKQPFVWFFRGAMMLNLLVQGALLWALWR